MHTNLLDALMKSIAVPILAVDDYGHVLMMNQAARDLLPNNTIETSGIGLDALFPQWKDLLDELKASKSAFRQDIDLGQDRIGEASVTPLASYGWAITIYDATAHKEIEARKNNLLNEVTHDLKQPLSAILSFSDIVQASGDLSDRQLQYLDRIRSSAARMTEQVHQLLDVAWIEAGMKLTLSEVDPLSLVRATLDELETRATTKHIRLALDAPDEPIPTFTGDGSRLRQVLTNLITNAIKYSGENSTVSVHVWAEDRTLYLSVTDQGMGIAQEHLPRLFDRFYRIKDKNTRQIEGTGLGLYIARSIVEQHGGQITAQSEPGQGSVFTVSLPLAQPPASKHKRKSKATT
ncbi:MAG TPA: HAMP domain-containing sensor histidine kinase [Aggregatilineales bacterium]|nr:HAMP domain-containing sensor histidine kinase [Aggregatilineales bacterium]